MRIAMRVAKAFLLIGLFKKAMFQCLEEIFFRQSSAKKMRSGDY